MPLRPFPHQLSVGTDIVHVNRIRAIILKDAEKPGYLDRFLRRFLTLPERNEFNAGRQRETGNGLKTLSKHLAGRWAAKEAAIKAVSWRRIGFHDVVIRRSGRGSGVFAIILDHPFKERENAETDATCRNRTQTVDGVDLGSSDSRVRHVFQKSSTGVTEILTKHATDTASPTIESTNDLSYDGQNRNNIFDDMAGQTAKLSISHDGDYATAVCLAAEEPMAGDVGGEAGAREPS